MNSFGNRDSTFFRRVLLAALVILVSAGIAACGAGVDDAQKSELSANTDERSSDTDPEMDVLRLIGQAEASAAEAKTLGHAWTVTETLIDAAVAALKAGDVAQARELAQRALATATASVDQAKLEAKAWRSRVPG